MMGPLECVCDPAVIILNYFMGGTEAIFMVPITPFFPIIKGKACFCAKPNVVTLANFNSLDPVVNQSTVGIFNRKARP